MDDGYQNLFKMLSVGTIKVKPLGTTIKVKPLDQIKEKFHGKVGHITRIVDERFPFMYEVTFRGVYVDESFLFTGEELAAVWAPDFDLHFPPKGKTKIK